MTHHDTVIDSIVQQIYDVWMCGPIWDEQKAKEKAQLILESVEEFQSKREKISRWRASD